MSFRYEGLNLTKIGSETIKYMHFGMIKCWEYEARLLRVGSMSYAIHNIRQSEQDIKLMLYEDNYNLAIESNLES